jgi:hypothetical protein
MKLSVNRRELCEVGNPTNSEPNPADTDVTGSRTCPAMLQNINHNN